MYNYKAKLMRVVDGDTIDAEIDLGFKIFIKERIRLMGIDTPESRTRNLAEKSWGKAAKYRLEELLAEADGDFTLVTKMQKKGKFGRILGTIQVSTKDGIVDANQILMNEQLAIPYTGGNKEESRTAAGVLDLWNTYYEHTKKD
jgi:micrococcal nuclease|tara:strand:- start:1926 stop:2357 length:432 start_codon:yes stop_codon:yes gene_type:complete